MEQADTLSHEQFADFFIERITEFVRERPALSETARNPATIRICKFW
jgi:hypothetical protein